MRGTTPATSATERRLDVIKDLLKVLPRDRGFRVAADCSVSVYPASQRAARLPAAKQGRWLPAAKQGRSPRSKRESRSEQGSKRAATNARTRRSAARAAKHAERREAEIRLWQLACKMAKVRGWRHSGWSRGRAL